MLRGDTSDAIAQEALARAEVSQKLRDSEPKQLEISVEEGNILCHMLNKEYEKAAKMARKYGFNDLAEDAATGLVIEQMRNGMFAHATKTAEEYGLNNYAAAAALFWAKSEVRSAGSTDHVFARFCAKEFARSEFKGSSAFALWESLENIQRGLGDQFFAAYIAQKYEKISDDSFHYRNLLSNMKWETAVSIIQWCMHAGNFRTMSAVANEFGIPKRDLRDAAFRVARFCIETGDYKAADKIESFFKFNGMRHAVSDAMEENFASGDYARIAKTAEHYRYVSGGFGFPAQERQLRYMEVESLMGQGEYLKAARKAKAYGFISIRKEAAKKAVESYMAKGRFRKVSSIARELYINEEVLHNSAIAAAQACIREGDYKSAERIDRRYS
jgi:hypothetical protein